MPAGRMVTVSLCGDRDDSEDGDMLVLHPA